MMDAATTLIHTIYDLDRQRADALARLRIALTANGGASASATEEAAAPPFAPAPAPRASPPRTNGRGSAPPGSTRARMLQNATHEQDRIFGLLTESGRPMTSLQVATALSAKKSTTNERLRRLREMGRAVSAEGGLWSAVAP